ncbi:DUF3500 domain-containing protein [Streptomyces sp. NPDC056405]|uniref:DUF3500 domain-containing protein n=1 Tax=Streptomyces sp. NPDC056405 TaxID=3345811 RepID=UPI0035D60B04
MAVMVAAAHQLVDTLDKGGRARLSYPGDAVERQTWSNPEFLHFDTGLRLEFQPVEVRRRTCSRRRMRVTGSNLRKLAREPASYSDLSNTRFFRLMQPPFETACEASLEVYCNRMPVQ